MKPKGFAHARIICATTSGWDGFFMMCTRPQRQALHPDNHRMTPTPLGLGRLSAAQKGAANVESRFKNFDQNGDGKLSREEFITPAGR